MASYQFKQTLTNIEKAMIVLWGPYEGTNKADGFGEQALEFNWDEKTVAKATLKQGMAYEAMITLFGEREGKITLEIKMVDGAAEYSAAASVTIPKNARRRSPALGYVYATSFEIKAL